jgi:hypothetical protein
LSKIEGIILARTKATGTIKAAIPIFLPKAGEVKIPLDLLKEFVAEKQTLHIHVGPDWIGIIAIDASFMKRLLANAKIVQSMQEAGMKAALQGQVVG